MLFVAVSSECIDVDLPISCDLAKNVGRRTKAVEPKVRNISRQPQAAVPNETCAKKRRKRCGFDVLPKGKYITRLRDAKLRIATVDRVAGKTRVVAQVLAIAGAVGAMSAGVPKPGHSNALTATQAGNGFAKFFDAADDFMPRDQR